MMGLIPWYKFFPTPASVRFVNAVRSLEAIASQLAEERMAELKQKIENNEEFEAISFLDQWLLDDTISREEIFSLMRDFLAAGIDTVSTNGVCCHYISNPHPNLFLLLSL